MSNSAALEDTPKAIVRIYPREDPDEPVNITATFHDILKLCIASYSLIEHLGYQDEIERIEAGSTTAAETRQRNVLLGIIELQFKLPHSTHVEHEQCLVVEGRASDFTLNKDLSEKAKTPQEYSLAPFALSPDDGKLHS